MSNEKKTGNGIKGFIDDLKRTPKTLEEAKTKTKKFFILIGGFALLFSVLCALLHIAFGLIVALGSAGLLAFLYSKENQKNKRNFCAECGERIDYERGVAWEVIKNEEKTCPTNSGSSGKQAIKKRMSTVQFTCTCISCGNVKEFTQTYETVVWYDDGTIKQNNVETFAKNYFKI